MALAPESPIRPPKPKCVRLLAKADDAASLAPVVERHALSRGGE